jgi:hypothetical protein
MKIIVFIPTFPRDFNYLDEIINMYINGSILPNNIIISVGSYNFKYKDFFDNLEKKYPLVKIIRDNKKLLAAENRYKVKFYDFDIVVYQDSDDCPHPDRIKIVKYYFEKYPDLMHLHHSYKIDNCKFEKIDLSKINENTSDIVYKNYFDIKSKKFEHKKRLQAFNLFNYRIHAGVGIYKKEVIDTIDWSSYNFRFMYDNPENIGEDYEYMMKTIEKYNKGLFIDADLYYYNTQKRPFKYINK